MDEDLERLLQQYRPVGPPAALRTRVVRRPLVEWLPAAAALLLAALFYSLAANARRDVAAAAAAIEVERERKLSELTRTLGDGVLARDAAERLLEAEEQMARRDAEQNPGSVIRD